MNISQLMKQFSKCEYAEVGFGYKHPEKPNPSMKQDVIQFFHQYPMLMNDKGYLGFLEMYGGAEIVHPESEYVLMIHGVSLEGVINIVKPDESLVEKDRYFRFAEVSVFPLDITKHMYGAGFAFDIASINRGVYRQLSLPGLSLKEKMEQPFTPFCQSFIEWLHIVVSNKDSLLAITKE